MATIPRTEEQRAQRRAKKKEARERRRALGLPIARTEQARASRRAQKKRARERKAYRLAVYKANIAPELEEKRRLKAIESQKKHREAHADYYRVYDAIKKAKRRSLYIESDEFDKFVFSEAHYLRLLRSRQFGFSWHVDHIIPISKGGTNKYDNLQVVPAVWNMQKGNRHSERYINSERR